MTNEEKMIEVYRIAGDMLKAGLGLDFVDRAVVMARRYRGGYHLMMLWDEEEDPSEREEIIADLQQEIDDLDNSSTEPKKLRKIEFKELDNAVDELAAFKVVLRNEVERYGGITKLSNATGIAQPYLSKLFRSGIRPRYGTVAKICGALGVAVPNLSFVRD